MKDVDGDGRIDVFCRLIEMPFSQVVRFDSSRKQVWMSERLSLGSGDESGMPIVDLDGDGRHAGQFIRDAERPKANQPRTINRQKKQKKERHETSHTSNRKNTIN